MRRMIWMAAPAMLALGLEAGAATLNFNGPVDRLSDSEWAYSTAGVEVTVSSLDGPLHQNGLGDLTAGGIGVGTDPIDGLLTRGESLTIRFDQPVTLTGITFAPWVNPITVENPIPFLPDLVYPLSRAKLQGEGLNATLTRHSDNYVDALAHFELPEVTLESFTLRADHLDVPLELIALLAGLDLPFGVDDLTLGTYLWGIEFQPTTEIPLPGAVWLFGSALAGLGAAGRRRSR